MFLECCSASRSNPPPCMLPDFTPMSYSLGQCVALIPLNWQTKIQQPPDISFYLLVFVWVVTCFLRLFILLQNHSTDFIIVTSTLFLSLICMQSDRFVCCLTMWLPRSRWAPIGAAIWPGKRRGWSQLAVLTNFLSKKNKRWSNFVRSFERKERKTKNQINKKHEYKKGTSMYWELLGLGRRPVVQLFVGRDEAKNWTNEKKNWKWSEWSRWQSDMFCIDEIALRQSILWECLRIDGSVNDVTRVTLRSCPGELRIESPMISDVAFARGSKGLGRPAVQTRLPLNTKLCCCFFSTTMPVALDYRLSIHLCTPLLPLFWRKNFFYFFVHFISLALVNWQIIFTTKLVKFIF